MIMYMMKDNQLSLMMINLSLIYPMMFMLSFRSTENDKAFYLIQLSAPVSQHRSFQLILLQPFWLYVIQRDQQQMLVGWMQLNWLIMKENSEVFLYSEHQQMTKRRMLESLEDVIHLQLDVQYHDDSMDHIQYCLRMVEKLSLWRPFYELIFIECVITCSLDHLIWFLLSNSGFLHCDAIFWLSSLQFFYQLMGYYDVWCCLSTVLMINHWHYYLYMNLMS